MEIEILVDTPEVDDTDLVTHTQQVGSVISAITAFGDNLFPLGQGMPYTVDRHMEDLRTAVSHALVVLKDLHAISEDDMELRAPHIIRLNRHLKKASTALSNVAQKVAHNLAIESPGTVNPIQIEEHFFRQAAFAFPYGLVTDLVNGRDGHTFILMAW